MFLLVLLVALLSSPLLAQTSNYKPRSSAPSSVPAQRPAGQRPAKAPVKPRLADDFVNPPPSAPSLTMPAQALNLATSPAPAPTPPPAPPQMFGFALPPFDATKTPVDLSYMNDAPAGKTGFVRTDGEHFVDGQGKRLRFWGVNVNFAGAFPSKEEAAGIAARLAKFGFNAVRLHHYEGYPYPNGIWSAAGIGSSRLKFPRELDPNQLDKFDFFISELIKRGIYINLNLHVARKTTDADGVPSAADLPEKDKGVNYYDERLMKLQREFTRTILTHVNPYTGRALKDEPGVCAIEVANENSLLAMWLDGSFKVPSFYGALLRDKWNAWLRKKYTEKTLRAAWTEADAPLGPVNLFAQPLPMGIFNGDAPDARTPVSMNSLSRLSLATVSGASGTMTADPISGPSVDGFVRPGVTISLDKVGTVTWSFQVNRDGLDLEENRPYTLSFWARADTPRRISVNLWQDRRPTRFQGFTGYADLTNDWQQFSYMVRPANPDPGHSRLAWNLGNQTGAVQLGEIDLRPGGRIATPEQWTLSNGVPLIDFKLTQVWTARRDYAEFLGEIEKEHVGKMRKFLKEELGVKVPIWHSQAQFGGWGGIAREMESDALDVHAYWKHPDFGATGWSGTSWKVGNLSMTASAGSDPLSAFAYYRVPGKPTVMTEWNSGQPNDFGAESLIMAAAYAAWQEWAAVYVFDYHSSGLYNRDKFEGFFSIDSHPLKMISAPAAALMYRRPAPVNDVAPGDIAPAQETTTLTVPRDWIWNEVANAPDGPSAAPIIRTWQQAGGARSASLQTKVYVRFGEGIFPTVTKSELRTDPVWLTDTGEIVWDAKKNLWNLNTPRSKSLIGFVGGKGKQNLDEWTVQMPATQSNWAAFSLSSLDGAPVATSKSLLINTMGKAENLNMGWNADRSSVGNNWGAGPTQVEGISADMELMTSAKSARVWVLDNTGGQRREVPSTLKNGVLRFTVSPTYRTAWYQVTTQ